MIPQLFYEQNNTYPTTPLITRPLSRSHTFTRYIELECFRLGHSPYYNYQCRAPDIAVLPSIQFFSLSKKIYNFLAVQLDCCWKSLNKTQHSILQRSATIKRQNNYALRSLLYIFIYLFVEGIICNSKFSLYLLKINRQKSAKVNPCFLFMLCFCLCLFN